MSTYSLEAILVFFPALLKEIAQVQDWFVQAVLATKVKGNEQSTKTTISIDEWVNSFKLVMLDGNVNQWLKLWRCNEEAFEVLQ